MRNEEGWLVGTGVAASVYPTYPVASVAGGSSGTTTWGSAIVEAARAFRDKFGADLPDGDEAQGEVQPATQDYAMFAFGAQFAEARVHADTGEIRVSRLHGTFAAGRIINPRTARSMLDRRAGLGLPVPKGEPVEHRPPSPALAQVTGESLPISGRRIGVLAGPQADLAGIERRWRPTAQVLVIAPHGGQLGKLRHKQVVERTNVTTRSSEFGAVVVADGAPKDNDIKAVVLLQEAYRQLKPFAAWRPGAVAGRRGGGGRTGAD